MSGKEQALRQAIEAYFAACDATRERSTLKNGGIAERQIPYTLYGLCAALDVTREEALQASRDGATWQRRPLQNAMQRIAAYTMERALLGELTHQMAVIALNDLGSPLPQEAAGAAVTVTMDEPSRGYAV